MNEIVGDFFDEAVHFQALCCTTNTVIKYNGELVMGTGIARVFAKKWPNLSKHWGNRITNGQHVNGFMVDCLFLRHNQSNYMKHVVAFPTKDDWRKPSTLKRIESSCMQLITITSILGLKSILLPRPGCTNGGLNWENDVRPFLEKILPNRVKNLITIISKEE